MRANNLVLVDEPAGRSAPVQRVSGISTRSVPARTADHRYRSTRHGEDATGRERRDQRLARRRDGARRVDEQRRRERGPRPRECGYRSGDGAAHGEPQGARSARGSGGEGGRRGRRRRGSGRTMAERRGRHRRPRRTRANGQPSGALVGGGDRGGRIESETRRDGGRSGAIRAEALELDASTRPTLLSGRITDLGATRGSTTGC